MEYNATLRDYESAHQKHLKDLESTRRKRLIEALDHSSKLKTDKLMSKQLEREEDISIATTLASIKEFRSDEKKMNCGKCKKTKRALFINKISN